MRSLPTKIKLLMMLFILCMTVCLMPTVALAAGGASITEVDINGVSGELWSYKDAPFVTNAEENNYTIESQEWRSDHAGSITPSSASLKPTAGEKYTFTITLKAKDGYTFSTDGASKFAGTIKVEGAVYDGAETTVADDGKTLTVSMFQYTKVKGITNSSVRVDTDVQDHYTDQQIAETITVTRESGYTVHLEAGTPKITNPVWFKLNDDDTKLVVAEEKDAILSIKPDAENDALIVAFTDNMMNANISCNLNFLYTAYTGCKLTYTDPTTDPSTGMTVIHEIRDDYYTRIYFNCPVNLIAKTTTDINQVVIQDVKCDYAAGDAPQVSARRGSTSMDTYDILYECWEEMENNDPVAFWYSDESKYTSDMKRITQFEEGKRYMYSIELRARDGYSFPDNCTVMVDDTAVNAKNIIPTRDGTRLFVVAALTMTPQVPADYKIIEGANGTWMQNGDGTLKFVANGEFSKFTGVKVDGALLAAEQYSAVSGSTVITLKKEYLDTLSVGTHTLTVVYSDGDCSTVFVISAAAPAPATPTPTPTASPAPAATETPTPTPAATAAPTVTPAETATPAPTATLAVPASTATPAPSAAPSAIPQTSDGAPIPQTAVIFLVSAAALAALGIRKKRIER